MSRLIDADALKKIMCEDCDNIHLCTDSPACETVNQIENAPTVDAEPVRQGRWIRKESKRCYWYECSECGYPPPLDRYKHEWFSDYCPHCGARTDEVEE